MWSRRSCSPSAQRSTDARLERSSGIVSTRAPAAARRICCATASALSTLRHARRTVAPARASSRAVISPMPLVAPVTTMTRPSWSGMSWTVQVWLMRPNTLRGGVRARLRRGGVASPPCGVMIRGCATMSFGFDVADDARRDALALRIEDHLWGDGVTFDRWTMRLTVAGDTRGRRAEDRARRGARVDDGHRPLLRAADRLAAAIRRASPRAPVRSWSEGMSRGVVDGTAAQRDFRSVIHHGGPLCPVRRRTHPYGRCSPSCRAHGSCPSRTVRHDLSRLRARRGPERGRRVRDHRRGEHPRSAGARPADDEQRPVERRADRRRAVLRDPRRGARVTEAQH